jgi:hypothetical protein
MLQERKEKKRKEKKRKERKEFILPTALLHDIIQY